MDIAFTVANEYRSKFEPYRAFYDENDALDVEQMNKQDHGNHTHPKIDGFTHFTLFFPTDVAFFRKWLGRYRLEHIQCKNCPVEKDLGLLLVSTNTLKSELLPSPVKCLDVSVHTSS